MSQQTLEVSPNRNGAEQADILTVSPARTAPDHNLEQYVHPFTLVPRVAEPELDIMFSDVATQRTSRGEALFNLSALTIIEQGGPSNTTDSWLEILRQIVRETSDKLPEFNRERASMMGQVAMHLSADTSLRRSQEAEIYKMRVDRAELEADGAYISGSPYRAAHLSIKESLNHLQGTPLEVAQNVAPSLPTDPETPDFTIAKAKALFEYASTMTTSEEKRQLLFEAMGYATETIARADPSDNTLRASALHILSRSIYDASYIPLAYSWNEKANNRRNVQARKLAVEMLRQTTLELQTAHGNRVPTPADTSSQWQVPSISKTEELTRYFSGIYPEHIPTEETTPGNPEIKRIIVTKTAQMFGHEVVTFADMGLEPAAREPEPTKKEYTVAS